jgi:hypothetical protein
MVDGYKQRLRSIMRLHLIEWLILAASIAGMITNLFRDIVFLSVPILTARIALAVCAYAWILLIPMAIIYIFFKSERYVRSTSYYILWSHTLSTSCLSLLGWLWMCGFTNPFEVIRWAIKPGWFSIG